MPLGRNYSYADGDIDFNWSPDSKYIITSDNYFGFGATNAAVIKADGTGEIMHPINSGFGENNPMWAMDGKLILWEN